MAYFLGLNVSSDTRSHQLRPFFDACRRHAVDQLKSSLGCSRPPRLCPGDFPEPLRRLHRLNKCFGSIFQASSLFMAPRMETRVTACVKRRLSNQPWRRVTSRFLREEPKYFKNFLVSGESVMEIMSHLMVIC